MGIQQALRDVHSQIKAEAKARNDKAIANSLENFLNEVIYGKELIDKASAGLDDDLTKILNAELVKIVQEKLKNNHLNIKFTSSGNFTWDSLEIIVSSVLQTAFNNIGKEKTNFSVSKAGTGTGKTFAALDNIPQDLVDRIKNDKSLALSQKSKKSRGKFAEITIPKDMKPDAIISMKGELNNMAERNLAIIDRVGFSIKNYPNNFKLEAVNPIKVYMATLTKYDAQLGKLTDNQKRKLYDYYLGQGDPGDVLQHITHLSYIFALTGYGLYNSVTYKINPTARFLIANSGKQIRVYSTAEITLNILGVNSTTNFAINSLDNNISLRVSGTKNKYTRYSKNNNSLINQLKNK